MQHYPHHIGDFDKATRHLSRIERSVYRDLLDVYYDTEKMLPLDVPALCRKILATSEQDSTAVEQVLNEFFVKTPAGWFHSRCDHEIEKFHGNTSQKSAAGKASAQKRALKKQQAFNGRSTDVEVSLQRNPTNQEPITYNQEPLFTTTAEAPSGTAVPGCPHKPIVDLYNRILPELSQVLFTRWEGSARAKALQARWRESENHQSLEFWERYFTALRDYPFYLGENNRSWKADLGWLVERRNFDKLLEKFVTGTP